ncbi:hypothetical protein [Kamptonema formosum]|nr:hypothetical protein [Oscillatoria sp. PCC 10802]
MYVNRLLRCVRSGHAPYWAGFPTSPLGFSQVAVTGFFADFLKKYSN